jgi:hypothetical protein
MTASATMTAAARADGATVKGNPPTAMGAAATQVMVVVAGGIIVIDG